MRLMVIAFVSKNTHNEKTQHFRIARNRLYTATPGGIVSLNISSSYHCLNAFQCTHGKATLTPSTGVESRSQRKNHTEIKETTDPVITRRPCRGGHAGLG